MLIIHHRLIRRGVDIEAPRLGNKITLVQNESGIALIIHLAVILANGVGTVTMRNRKHFPARRGYGESQ